MQNDTGKYVQFNKPSYNCNHESVRYIRWHNESANSLFSEDQLSMYALIKSLT